ncbi:MAG: DUF4403 family protein [Pseudomonadota bacterium]
MNRAASTSKGISIKTILLGGLVVAVFFGGTLFALDALWPSNPMSEKRPALTELPPLPPISRISSITAPVAVANTAIRDVLDSTAPRNLSGNKDNPLSELLGKAEIGYSIARGPMSVSGANQALTISTPLNGSLRVTGNLAGNAGNAAGAITGILGNALGRNVGNIVGRTLDQRADIRGAVTVTSRPVLLPNWRIEPNLTGNVSIGETSVNIAGVKLNLGNEMKPLLDKTVSDQIANLSNQLRNDPRLEQIARREWAKMCRSIPLGQASKDAPNLWLELKPVRASAATPRIDPNWVILTVGVQAETRIVPSETKPNCPFPQRLEIVQQLDQGKVSIAVPIDMPFTELNRIMELQLKGKTFGEKDSPAEVTVLKSNVAASGDRLLVSLRVKAKEKKSWFGFGAEATVHVWGKPVLDREKQIMRLTDISLDVESEAAFGLLGAAAKAAIPYVQSALEENAVVDLKPFAATARGAIESAIKDFQSQTDGVQAEAQVTGLRLEQIEFDSKTLRVIAEADGLVRALVTKIAVQ